MNAIIPYASKPVLALPGRATTTGLELDENLSFEEWQAVGDVLQYAEGSLMWWLGDWLQYGERRYGEMYSQGVLDATGRNEQALKNAKWVARRFEKSRRRDFLSWSHHEAVAGLKDTSAADRLLSLAEQEGWTHKELRRRVTQTRNTAKILANEPGDGTCTLADLWRAVELGKRFGTIYADPPWLYDNQVTRASTENHYGGMTVDEISALPVGELAADDAHLHLWTTNGFLYECPRLFEAWGFEFKSSFVWVKPKIGIGNYWRNAHEILLTAVRGNAKSFNDHTLQSWIECDRGKHSSKPEQVRGFLERASNEPRIELFARRPAEGWTVWGNQIERSLFDQSVREVA